MWGQSFPTKYLKPDLILNILLKQAYSISEPWTLAQSLKNIDEWLLLVTSFFEFKMQGHINSKLRDDLIPRLFTETYRFCFVEMVQAFETTLSSASPSSTDPLAICMENLTTKSETTEIQSFTSRLESASDPVQEEKRLSFWLESIRKLALQMRQLSLYSDDKKPPPHNQFYEQPLKHNSAKGGQQGGHSLKISCLVCPNKHMSQRGRPTQYLGACQFFQDQNISKKKELIKSAKVCFQCLIPMINCRKPEDPKVCSKQTAWGLKLSLIHI